MLQNAPTNSIANLPDDGDETKIVIQTYQYIVIRLGDEDYGIDINFIDNIVRMQHITRIPKVASFLKGVINLRGEVIPVMSLRVKMGLQDDVIDRATRIIILKTENEGNLGIMVDEVKEVVTLSENQIEKVGHDADGIKEQFVSAVGKNGNQLISLLDLSMINLDDAN
ncbi:MAG: chemotaxis protein CheW [Lachnospiraceae bacterium]|nr:chemotaxis protein CheW [Lachnospiraceae bacterium]